MGNKRGARIKLARTQAELEKLFLQQGFQDLRAEAADLFLEAILQRELLEVQKSSYEYMYQLSQSDSLRYVSGEITENDVRQSKLETVTLISEYLFLMKETGTAFFLRPVLLLPVYLFL